MVIVETYKDCEIYLWANGQFEARDRHDKQIASASTLLEVKNRVDRHVKEQSRFPRTPAISIEDDIEVRLNSRDVENVNYVWISFIDPITPTTTTRHGDQRKERPNWRRQKVSLMMGYHWGDDAKPKFVLQTPQNMAVLKKIQRINQSIAFLQDHKAELRKTYVDPVTSEFLDELMELKRFSLEGDDKEK